MEPQIFNPTLYIGEQVSSGTSGSVTFVDSNGNLAQNNANFFWDTTNHRLGIRTNTPAFPIDSAGDINTSTQYDIAGNFFATQNAAALNVFVGKDSGASITTGINNTGTGMTTLNTLASGSQNTAFGSSALSAVFDGNFNTALGYGAAGGGISSGSYNTLLGAGADTISDISSSIVIGADALASANNQLVIGGEDGSGHGKITDAYFGQGVTNIQLSGVAPTGVTLNATGGSGTNVAGGNFNIAGGRATGNATGGSIVFKTSVVGASGTTLQSLTERMHIDNLGNVNISGLTASKVVFTDASKNLTSTGVVGTGQGGTGTSTTFTQGSVIFAGASGVFSQDNSKFFWDDTNFRLGLGTATPTSMLNISGTSANLPVLTLTNTSNDANGPNIAFNKIRGAISQNNDELGYTSFSGSDGSVQRRAAYIISHVNGAPALGSVPGMLQFFTTKVGDADSTEKMRITNDGLVGIGTTTPGSKLDVVNVVRLTSTAIAANIIADQTVGSLDFYYNDDSVSAPVVGAQILASTPTGWSGANSNFQGDLRFSVSTTLAGSLVEMMRMNKTGLGIGTTTPNIQFEIGNTGTPSSNFTQYLSAASITHGMTNIVPTNVYGALGNTSTTNGGLGLNGFSDTGTTSGIIAVGTIGSNTPTATVPAIELRAAKKDVAGTGRTALASTETVLNVTNNGGTPLITVLGNGSLGDSFFTTNGGILYTNASGVFAQTGAGTSTTVLHGGTSPSYSSVSLTADVSGTLPVANGGTGTATAFTQGSVVFAGASGVYTQDNANFFWDDTNFRLGIGTASPANNLHIATNAAGLGIEIQSTNAGSDKTAINWRNSAGTEKWRIVNDQNANLTDDLRILSNGGATNVITMLQSGKTGIGTASPDARLTIAESADATQTTFTQGIGNAGVLIKTNFVNNDYTPGLFWSTSDNNNTKPKAGIYLLETNTGTNMLFGTSNSYSTGITNTAIYIDTSGKVGISNTAPTEALDVTGNLRLSGAFMPNNAAGSMGQILQSAGAGAADTWSTATYPATAGSAGNMLMSDGTNWISTDIATGQFTPADPTTTTNTTGVMMGLGTTATITTVRTTEVSVYISGDIDTTGGGNGSQVQIRFGTGTAPANGAALTGTTAGSLNKTINPNATGLTTTFTPGRNSFSLNAIITVSLATATWIDISLANIGGGTSRVRDISISLHEI